MMKRKQILLLLLYLVSQWRAQPIRHVLGLLAITLGVALGFAVHVINQSALNEFAAAMRTVNSQADADVVAPLIPGLNDPRTSGLDDRWFDYIAQHQSVAHAHPALELKVYVPRPSGVPLQVQLIGMDVFTAGYVAPQLIGTPASTEHQKPALTWIEPGVFASPALLDAIGLKVGQTITLVQGAQSVQQTIIGTLPNARDGQKLLTMDIAHVQQLFKHLGQITRISVRLKTGVNPTDWREELRKSVAAHPSLRWPAHAQIEVANQTDSRLSNLSRAYRVNLQVLAAVALFTGLFMVYATQTLSIMRQASVLAFLRIVGLTRKQVLQVVLAEGAVLGVLGGLIGIAVGAGMAAALLRLVGADLGAGYFAGIKPHVHLDVLSASIYLLLAVCAGVVGSVVPARLAARHAPARTLKTGALAHDHEATHTTKQALWGLACICSAPLLALLPPLYGLPIAAYGAIALLLVGSILICPWAAHQLIKPLARHGLGLATPWRMAVLSLRGAQQNVAIAMTAVVVSTALMVGMGAMVYSFRTTVIDWLDRVLPAPLYMRVTQSGQSLTATQLETARQLSLRTIEQVQRPMTLNPEKPPVALIARQIELAGAAQDLPMMGAALNRPPASSPQLRPVWVTEAYALNYQTKLGDTLTLPITSNTAQAPSFFVAGIWRDYGRQHGAILIRLADYQDLTQDKRITDVAIVPREGAQLNQVMQTIRELNSIDQNNPNVEFMTSEGIRALSLQIFDRTFAITYALAAAAMIVGMFGIATTLSGQLLARHKEFGMLRHIGVTVAQIRRQLVLESIFTSATALILGISTGIAIAWILVHVVNPQSFSWTMPLLLPSLPLIGLGVVIVGLSAFTAFTCARTLNHQQLIASVRQDW